MMSEQMAAQIREQAAAASDRPDVASEPTYTLAEAQRELARRECANHGHNWMIHQNIKCGPLRISCDRCDWSGAVTMEPTPPTRQLSTPTEIIDQRAAGDIDDDEMMAALLSRSYSPGMHDPTGGDGYIRGSWGEIERALGKGLLSDEEYERIARGGCARQGWKP